MQCLPFLAVIASVGVVSADMMMPMGMMGMKPPSTLSDCMTMMTNMSQMMHDRMMNMSHSSMSMMSNMSTCVNGCESQLSVAAKACVDGQMADMQAWMTTMKGFKPQMDTAMTSMQTCLKSKCSSTPMENPMMQMMCGMKAIMMMMPKAYDTCRMGCMTPKPAGLFQTMIQRMRGGGMMSSSQSSMMMGGPMMPPPMQSSMMGGPPMGGPPMGGPPMGGPMMGQPMMDPMMQHMMPMDPSKMMMMGCYKEFCKMEDMESCAKDSFGPVMDKMHTAMQSAMMSCFTKTCNCMKKAGINSAAPSYIQSLGCDALPSDSTCMQMHDDMMKQMMMSSSMGMSSSMSSMPMSSMSSANSVTAT